MHQRHLLAYLLLGVALTTSCKKQYPILPKQEDTTKTEEPKAKEPKEEEPKPEGPKEEQPKPTEPSGEEAATFPIPDNSIELTGYPAEMLLAMLSSKQLDQPIALGETQISQTELAEIKKLSDKLVKESQASNQLEKHRALFKWITSNVKYGHILDTTIPNYNSAYSSYKYKNAICQGYANLLKVMCYTQGINAPVVNGLAKFRTVGPPVGHAWNYTLLDGKWYVSDPTNNIFYEAERKDKFDFLLPERLDFALWQDDKLTYIYENKELTVGNVHGEAANGKLIVPYSIGGFRITNFNPSTLPKSIREIYLGANIKHLGVSGNRKLLYAGAELEKIAIDPENKHLENYRGSIYERGEGAGKLLLIPAQLKKAYLKAEKEIGKNIIYNHQGIEELHFAEGTEVIMDYAVEKCPNLQTVYVPQSIKTIAPKAFAGCDENLKIVRY